MMSHVGYLFYKIKTSRLPVGGLFFPLDLRGHTALRGG